MTQTADERINEALDQITDWEETVDSDRLYNEHFPNEVTRSKFRDAFNKCRHEALNNKPAQDQQVLEAERDQLLAERKQLLEEREQLQQQVDQQDNLTVEIGTRPDDSAPGEQIDGSLTYAEDSKPLPENES